MVIPKILARSWQGLQSSVTASMELFGAKPPEKLKPSSSQDRGGCFCCKNYNRVRGKCDICDRFTCDFHLQKRCQNCRDNEEKD
ncbi:unnamed protein product [Allacma fusca]|uniref:Uncharacterized protein n=1 Tax=Allacma fusca TaxID=39272 RepID=A0A8J2LI34_9HEXA|nr:unnamed protein product [Allacma fusca]